MRIGRFSFLTVGFLLAGSVAAGAQEKGKAGVAIGYPGGIGILWHATDTVAIRPAFAFSHLSTDGSTSSGSAGSLDLSVLFYLKKYENVRTYVSPRFSYSRTSTTVQASSAQAAQPEVTTTSTSTGGAGAFGVQYSPGAHFSVFGELGLSFSSRKAEAGSVLVSNSKAHTWGTTAGVGVVFYP